MTESLARPAKFVDIAAIIRLGLRCHSESRLSQTCGVDEAVAKDFLYGAIAGHSYPAEMMRMAVFVTDAQDGEVSGVIIGLLQPKYFVLTQAIVTDLIWYVDPDAANPRDGNSLKDALHAWADTFQHGSVGRYHAVNDTVMDPRVTGRMFRMAGYRKTGEIYEKEAGE